MRSSLVLAVAYAIDVGFGEPPNAAHPVAWMGSVIGRAKTWALRGDRLVQLVRGGLAAVAIPSFFAAAAYEVLAIARPFPVVPLIVSVFLLKSAFAVRSLRDAAYAVRDALEAGDLPLARRALGSLCSRKADDLDAEQLVAATIESVAENTSDSIVAPLFYFALGGVPAAVFYRAVNTLDAMVGYHGRLEYAGKASARLDDLLNLVPARLTALFLLVAGGLTGRDVRSGGKVLARDARLTESPNAGWPMATMAGLLGVQLTKVDHYVLGDAVRPLVPAQITSAWRVTSTASLLFAASVGLLVERLS